MHYISFDYVKAKFSNQVILQCIEQGLKYRIVTDKNINKVFDVMLMFVRVFRFLYMLCTARKGVAQRSGHLGLTFRGKANPLREKHHEDKQARKNAYRTEVGMWDVLLNDRKSCAKLTEMRGIANSKNLVLMQGLVYGGWSVHGHPKTTRTRRHRALKLPLRHGKDTSVGD
ncbi:hypothetical protein BHE74_00040768 [Ensete ventricosum]|nr:hypothetical protein BHE74_00040768 [Ensete ventricosum]